MSCERSSKSHQGYSWRRWLDARCHRRYGTHNTILYGGCGIGSTAGMEAVKCMYASGITMLTINNGQAVSSSSSSILLGADGEAGDLIVVATPNCTNVGERLRSTIPNRLSSANSSIWQEWYW